MHSEDDYSEDEIGSMLNSEVVREYKRRLRAGDDDIDMDDIIDDVVDRYLYERNKVANAKVDKKMAIVRQIIALLDESLEQGDIANGVVVPQNLERFNQANAIAEELFRGVQFTPPLLQSNYSFAESSFECDALEFKDKRKDLLLKLLNKVDFFEMAVSASLKGVSLRYGVNDVYAGEDI